MEVYGYLKGPCPWERLLPFCCIYFKSFFQLLLLPCFLHSFKKQKGQPSGLSIFWRFHLKKDKKAWKLMWLNSRFSFEVYLFITKKKNLCYKTFLLLLLLRSEER